MFLPPRKTGNYYGIKKVRGKIKKCSIGTNDRKLAERKLKGWIGSLERRTDEIDLTSLCDLFLETRGSKKERSLKATNGQS